LFFLLILLYLQPLIMDGRKERLLKECKILKNQN